jgi:hypothetical protein
MEEKLDGKRRKVSPTNANRIKQKRHNITSLQLSYENGFRYCHGEVGTTSVPLSLIPPERSNLTINSEKKFPKGTIAEMVLGCNTEGADIANSMIDMVKSITIPKVGNSVGIDMGPRLRQACLYFVMSSSLPPMLVP